MKASYTLIFNRKDKLDDKGKGLIQLQVYLDREKRKLISTKVRILPEEWDPKKHQVKPLDDNLVEKHEMLTNMIHNLESFEMELIRKGEELTPARIDEYFSREKDFTFNAFIEKELKENHSLKYGTTKQHWITLRKLNAFQPVIQFREVNYDLIARFDQYLHSLDLGVNTIADHHKNLRRYVQIAIRKNLMRSNQHPYRGKFKVKREPVSRSYLSDEEILQLEKIDYPLSEKLQKIQDMFLFCIYSGLRYSDMQNLQPAHIQKTPEGLEIALHKMVKVPQPVFIPLHMIFQGKGEVILQKYLSDKNEYIFPRITDQKGNEYLKVICGHAKIYKQVSWHTARHTFGSQLAARYNDPYLIMQLMGHQEIKTSMIYIHSSQEIVKQKLKKGDW